MSLRRLAFALLCLPLGAGLSGCTGNDAGQLVINGTVTGVRHFDVTLKTQNGLHSDSFSEPVTEGAELVLPKTISITFPSTVAGYLLVHVDGKDGATTLASGDNFAPIIKGGVTQVGVTITAVSPSSTDGGAPDASVPGADMTASDGATRD